MRNIKRYNEFVNESKIDSYAKSQMVILSDIDLSLEDKEMMSKIVEKLYNDLSTSDKQKVDAYLEKREAQLSDAINEAFWDRFKKRIDKATEVSDEMPEESEGILKKIVRKAGEAVNFVGKLLKSAKEWITEQFKAVKEKVMGKLKGNSDFAEKVKGVFSENENGFIKDLKTGAKVLDFYSGNVISSLLKKMKEALSSLFSKDYEEVAIPESFDFESIDEGKNVLSTLIHAIEKVAPFSWLHKLAQAGEKGANKIIEALSWVTNKLGGPKFALPVIAVLIGIAFEYNIKGSIKHGLLHVLGGAFTGGLLYFISYVATFVAAVIVIDSVVGGKVIGGAH
jgi:hypothetical protein